MSEYVKRLLIERKIQLTKDILDYTNSLVHFRRQAEFNFRYSQECVNSLESKILGFEKELQIINKELPNE